MKYIFLFSYLNIVSALVPLKGQIKPVSTFSSSSSPFYSVKNTDYGTIETGTLSELYNGIYSHTIKGIYFSEDLKDVYFIQDGDVIFSRVVNSNPILTNSIIESANKNQIKTGILETPMNIYREGGVIINGLFSFATMAIGFSIVVNIIRLLLTGNSSNRNPMMPGGPFSFNTNENDNMIDKSTINVTLADWAGSPEVVEECSEIVSYIKNSTIYKAAGADIPKGILLDGPPGTGKTLLAKAIAGETNATFFSMSGSEFVELFVGMGAAKVRNLFDEARENIPAIIFIDEIDAVGKKRGSANAMNPNDEREQTLNQILAEMDGFMPNTGIVVMAATNRRDVLDDALLRPGRFDRLIYVPLPDRSSREAILRLYLKGKKTTNDINIPYLAENTGGFSGAQIKNLLNEAAIYAARNGETVITKDYMEQALEKVIIGITKRTDTRSEVARRRVAIHEIGHALLAAEFQNDFDLKKVSMKTTYNGVGGYTMFNEYPDVQESGLYTKDLLLKRIIISLGGKAAEILEYGENLVSVGASEDLKQANALAREMIDKFGMGNKLEVFSQDRLPYSDRVLDLIDKESMDIVLQCYDEAKIILLDKYPKLQVLMNLLLVENVLDGKTVVDIVHDRLNNSYVYEE
jgi:cell division protease FtsH